MRVPLSSCDRSTAGIFPRSIDTLLRSVLQGHFSHGLPFFSVNQRRCEVTSRHRLRNEKYMFVSFRAFSMNTLVVGAGIVILISIVLREIRRHRERILARATRLRLARLRKATMPEKLLQSHSPNPYGTWKEARNEVRRRRSSIPRKSPFMFDFTF